MSQMIAAGKEMIRINPNNPSRIQYSYNEGRTWLDRYIGSAAGVFLDLSYLNGEIVAQCQKGTFYSKDQGRTWLRRS
ncbi:MAG: hypothetical protein Q4P84_04440 [Elusimicrobiales bacterium]|nr:hypothetical protein [Elusimicrobiales bacterium]